MLLVAASFWAELVEFLFTGLILGLAIIGAFMLWWWHKREL